MKKQSKASIIKEAINKMTSEFTSQKILQLVKKKNSKITITEISHYLYHLRKKGLIECIKTNKKKHGQPKVYIKVKTKSIKTKSIKTKSNKKTLICYADGCKFQSQKNKKKAKTLKVKKKTNRITELMYRYFSNETNENQVLELLSRDIIEKLKNNEYFLDFKKAQLIMSLKLTDLTANPFPLTFPWMPDVFSVNTKKVKKLFIQKIKSFIVKLFRTKK